MDRHASVIENVLPPVDLFARPTPAIAGGARAPGHGLYAELATRLFEATPHRTVVAFVAAHRAEGVTRTIRGLAAELIRSHKRVAVLDGELRPIQIPGTNTREADFESRQHLLGTPLADEPSAASALIIAARDRYDCILLDCGSLEASVDVLRLASLADGVVLVVEAGRNSKEQIDYAAQFIGEAQGTLIGLVLNKRRYPIPEWLYRML